MFKDITINLTGPICFCDSEDLCWAIIGRLLEPELMVKCNVCLTSVKVPHKMFVANFSLEQDYPNGYAKNARILKLVPKEKEELK